MYYVNGFLSGIGILLWGTIMLLSCNQPHTTRIDAPAIQNLEADIDQRNHEGATALHIAVRRGDATVVNTLLNQIPEAERIVLIHQEEHDRWTALHKAALDGDATLVNTLLSQIPEAEARVALIHQSNNDGEDSLHIA